MEKERTRGGTETEERTGQGTVGRHWEEFTGTAEELLHLGYFDFWIPGHVGGEFEGDHVTSVIAHYDDGIDRVKLDLLHICVIDLPLQRECWLLRLHIRLMNILQTRKWGGTAVLLSSHLCQDGGKRAAIMLKNEGYRQASIINRDS
ncbi:hypothetical protein INR49_021625 [Caranx melampygus]|nr:hypothetical protein INR49_021625 [Caranx melampygus]